MLALESMMTQCNHLAIKKKKNNEAIEEESEKIVKWIREDTNVAI